MRPARKASRPASTAFFIAEAISTGSLAAAIAVFMSTPSQPSSIAIAASEAVPTPASTRTGTLRVLDDDLQIPGVQNPHAGADQRGQRHDGDSSRSLRAAFAMIGSSDVYTITSKPSATSVFAAFRVSTTFGKQRSRIAEHLQLHQAVPVEQLAREPQVRTASSARVAARGVREDREPRRAAARRAGWARSRSGRCWCGGSRP